MNSNSDKETSRFQTILFIVLAILVFFNLVKLAWNLSLQSQPSKIELKEAVSLESVRQYREDLERSVFLLHSNRPPKAGNLKSGLLHFLSLPNLTARTEAFDLHLYQMNHSEYKNQICQATIKNPDQKIRFLVEADMLEKSRAPALGQPSYPETIQALKDCNVTVRTDKSELNPKGGGESHNKFVIIDRRYLWTGSFNPTYNGTYKNANLALAIDSPLLAQVYQSEFDQIFSGRSHNKKSISRHPLRMDLGNKVLASVFFAPQDSPLQAIHHFLRKAKEKVQISLFCLSDPSILKHLVKLEKRGIELELLLEDSFLKLRLSKQFFNGYLKDWLQANLGHARSDGGSQKLHHKFMLVDSRHFLSGSFNFTGNAARINDENLLVLENFPLAGEVEKVFSYFYKNGKALVPRSDKEAVTPNPNSHNQAHKSPHEARLLCQKSGCSLEIKGEKAGEITSRLGRKSPDSIILESNRAIHKFNLKWPFPQLRTLRLYDEAEILIDGMIVPGSQTDDINSLSGEKLKNVARIEGVSLRRLCLLEKCQKDDFRRLQEKKGIQLLFDY